MKIKRERAGPDSPLLLLSHYLVQEFADIFYDIGFRVLWAAKYEGMEQIIANMEPDLAIEWQHGRDDFPVRDLLQKYGRKTPVMCALNWNRLPPADDPEDVGCVGHRAAVALLRAS